VLRGRLEPEASARGAIRDPAFLPSGKTLRLAAFGQRLLLSDLYWLRLVQYMGETLIHKADRWAALYPLAEIVTDLDPRHGYAYQVVGSNLAGLAGRHEEAERILLKGMRELPGRWNLPFTHAVNKFLYEQDYRTAAEYARRAAEIGKRPGLALLASNLAGLAGRHEEAERILLKGMRELPGRWNLPFTHAVNKFLYEKDYRTAAEYARRAAEIGKRPGLALLASNLALITDADDEYATTRDFLELAIEQASTDEMRQELRERLVKVRTYEVLSRVERAVAAYRAAQGRPPLLLLDLVTTRLLPGLPEDPSGGIIEYDPATGQVRSTVVGARAPLRIEP